VKNVWETAIGQPSNPVPVPAVPQVEVREFIEDRVGLALDVHLVKQGGSLKRGLAFGSSDTSRPFASKPKTADLPAYQDYGDGEPYALELGPPMEPGS
jgi:hypothetical protein